MVDTWSPSSLNPASCTLSPIPDPRLRVADGRPCAVRPEKLPSGFDWDFVGSTLPPSLPPTLVISPSIIRADPVQRPSTPGGGRIQLPFNPYKRPVTRRSPFQLALLASACDEEKEKPTSHHPDGRPVCLRACVRACVRACLPACLCFPRAYSPDRGRWHSSPVEQRVIRRARPRRTASDEGE